MRTVPITAMLLTLCVGYVARADEVIFNNGDKLTGTIGSLEDGKLNIKTKVAGDVKVDLADVKTFSTDGPIDLHLKDGTVIHQKVTNGDPGTVLLAPGGTLQPQKVQIAQVDKVNPPPVEWTGSLTAGGLITRGNSDTDAFNLAFNAVRRSEMDRITLDGSYLYARQKDLNTGIKSTTTDNWSFEAKYDYFVSPKLYVYGDGLLSRDRIAAVSIQFIPGVGVGYQWFESPKFNFNTEAGLSWFYEDFSNDGTNDHFDIRLAYHLDYKFNDTVKLFHDLELFPSLKGLSNYLLTTDVGIRADLTKTMFTEFKFQLNRNTEPAPGAYKNDLRYILGVGWNF